MLRFSLLLLLATWMMVKGLAELLEGLKRGLSGAFDVFVTVFRSLLLLFARQITLQKIMEIAGLSCLHRSCFAVVATCYLFQTISSRVSAKRLVVKI